jgi:hypothetical protein
MILGVVIPVEDGACRGLLHIVAESAINRWNNQLEWLFGDTDTLKPVNKIHSCGYITCFPSISGKARLKDFNVPNYGGLSDNNLLLLSTGGLNSRIPLRFSSPNITVCSPSKSRGW